MIVANKIDLRDQMRAEGHRVIEHDDGAKLAKVCTWKRKINMEKKVVISRNIKHYLLKQAQKMVPIQTKHLSN